ncbi:hypothetical protein [Thermoflexibacter ruber]|uniref:Uncharacterized protein n=1 Tax=Thermoflexibacter ruber TaxID=1003 RepID=A0A1I2FSH0_9BACT|nr:hypothetical protein [Thermoflexibacter ruber]SFF07829.1 hypothetical protein SAMN04488541_101512 [Thermoflexibacter ruber]
MKNLHQISENLLEKRNVTVVFKNSAGQFITALEVQNIRPPYIEKVKTRKSYLDKLFQIQSQHKHYLIDYWLSSPQNKQQYAKAQSETFMSSMKQEQV